MLSEHENWLNTHLYLLQTAGNEETPAMSAKSEMSPVGTGWIHQHSLFS